MNRTHNNILQKGEITKWSIKKNKQEQNHLVIIIRKWYIKNLNKHMNFKSMNTLRYKNTSQMDTKPKCV